MIFCTGATHSLHMDAYFDGVTVADIVVVVVVVGADFHAN